MNNRFLQRQRTLVVALFSLLMLAGMMNLHAQSVPTGAINGVFSVGENTAVYFSQGNLQYQASTNTWQFATNQFDYIGSANSNISSTYTGWIDLFGWGTSGYNHGATCYQPWSTSTTDGDYYAYGSYTYNLFDESGQADWGYNAISNGGNTTNTWRTPTHEEWLYIFNGRCTTSGYRFAYGRVNNVNGMILLPDNWRTDYFTLNSANNPSSSFSTNIISTTDWATLEQHGAVFLPAAGYRNGFSVNGVGSYCGYWSASNGNGGPWCHYLDGMSSATVGDSEGHSVRLVRLAFSIDANPNPSEGGTVSGAGTYEKGAECTLTATANEGYVFVNWTENGEVVSSDAEYTFTVIGDRTLVANFTHQNNNQTGLLNGLFSVSKNTQVGFSKGNLQYQASTNTWRFALNQWDFVGSHNPEYYEYWDPCGTVTGSDNANISENYDGWIDLFGWSTSGYDHGAVCYQPWSTSTSNSDYYAYGNYDNNLYDQTGQADWGFNAISNGGNTTNAWRTLTNEEWQYVFNTRTTSSGIRFGKARVNGVNGVILLPDDWSTDYYSLNSTNTPDANFSTNVINATDWAILEQHGAVFLPAAGVREGTWMYDVGSYGDYWSASYCEGDVAWYVYFFDGDLNTDFSCYFRYGGLSVRLVRVTQGFSFVIDATTSPTEGGVVSGAGAYEEDAECSLTAMANEGYVFVNWTENGEEVSTEVTYTFTVTSNRMLVANFVAIPVGTSNCLFSVSEGQQVQFSQGNLQYRASTNTLRFAENQYDYVGDANSNISDSYDGWIDLFGWGTSGYNHGATCYQPWSTSSSYSDYYAYGSDSYNLFDQTGQADWGYNSISNGGNTENSGWRTLTQEEWLCLFNTRITNSRIRYAKACVNNVNGVILLPDDWSANYYTLNSTNNTDANFSSNIITASQWNTLEQYGAVFLPAAGWRNGTSVNYVGSFGYYWSASCHYSDWARTLEFADSYLDDWGIPRYFGLSVRLVRQPQVFFIDATPSPAEGGAVSGAGAYEADTECTLTATANEGYHFAYWTLNGRIVSSNASYTFTVGCNWNLVANFAPDNSAGCLNGLFTTGENSSVIFSQGNLQYKASTNTWHFAEHQWDYVGSDNSNASSTNSGLIDLFGWGTSGYNHGANCYQPWSTNTYTENYYAYGNFIYHLFERTGQADWGYNAISNGGNTENSGWRTLTQEEWSYLFNIRSTNSHIRYAKACVNNVNGVILLPDDWSTSYYTLNSTNTYAASFSSNTITAVQWNTLEQHGAVFLPAAGYRFETSVFIVGSFGDYWSASYNDSDYAWGVSFGDSNLDTGDVSFRSFGFSVRLVRLPHGFAFVNAIPNLEEGGTVTGTGTYEDGAECTLTATANEGYVFVNWTENGEEVSTDAIYTFTVTGNRSLVANFADVPLTAVALNGLFSVNEGQQVQFSQGNLQYRASTNTWRFALRQWDCVGSDNSNISSTYAGWIDLFGWGTSGYDHGANCYQPWSTSTNNNGYYAYGSSGYNLNDKTGQADWGYNAIRNGGNTENSGWRTLTSSEWYYLFNTRATSSGIRYAKATVNGVNGVILLPDDWSSDYYTLNSTNTYNASFSTNVITAAQWATLEQHGAVFLPAAGYRYRTSVSNVGSFGNYWSASYKDNFYAYYVRFLDGYLNASDLSYRYYGRSVRLVRIVENCSINATPSPAEGGAVSGAGAYEAGAECTLTATANEGYVFVNWTENGEVVSTDAEYTFMVMGNRSLVANFERTTVTQQVTLSTGWNWFSSYIEGEDPVALLDMLKEALDDNALEIQSYYYNTEYAYYYGEWFGDLDDIGIDNAQTYMILAANDCTIEMEGPVTDPANYPITLHRGWNWIGFPCSQEVSVADAFAGFEPEEGDVLQSYDNMTEFDGEDWWGELETLVPGQGLMYYSMSDEPKVLVFQTGSGRAGLTDGTVSGHVHDPHYKVVSQGCTGLNTTLTGVLTVNGLEQRNGALEIGVFDQYGICRAAKLPVYRSKTDQWIYQLQIKGMEGAEYTFRVFDHESGRELDLVPDMEKVVYNTNTPYGSLDDPYLFAFVSTTGVGEDVEAVNLYPNPADKEENVRVELPSSMEPVGAKVEVYDALGKLVTTGTVNGSDVELEGMKVSGLYTVKVTDRQGNVCYSKLVVK